MSEPVSSSPEAAAPTGLAAVDALLAPFKRSDAPGLVVGIARDGKTIYRRAAGLASIELGVAHTPHTRVRIASISKQFTSFAVLLLAEDGKLSIDDPVQQHLTELPALSHGGPTLRQLMNHTAGWRSNVGAIAHGLAIQPESAAYALLVGQSELNCEPGTRMIYSNGGYRLLAAVVERVSGSSFEQFMQERVFEPLGMVDTESVPSDFDIRPGMASQYQAMPASAGGGWRRGIYPEELRGGGSMVSTIDDMLRWMAHLRGPERPIGSAASWASMSEPTTLSTGVEVPYGFGLMRHDYRGLEVVQHGGAVLGATSQMVTVPAHGLDIIVMANGVPVAPAFAIIDALLADVITEPRAPRVQASAYPALLGQHYHAPATGAVIGFAEVAGTLGMAWMGYANAPLRQGEGRVWLGCEDLAINPLSIDTAELAGDAAPAALSLSDGGNLLRFERLPDEAPSAAELADQLCGDYRAPDLDAKARIELDGEALMLRVQGRHGRHEMRLQPLSADVFLTISLDPLVMALGGGGIANVDRSAGRVVGLRLDSLRTRHVHLVRES